jgi:hypothetical protein
MKSLFISSIIAFSGAIRINSLYYSSELESAFPGVIGEHKMLREDLAKCKLEASGMEFTAWTEVCTSEISRIRDMHNNVVNKTSVWMLSLLDLGITDQKKNVSSQKNLTKHNITDG